MVDPTRDPAGAGSAAGAPTAADAPTTAGAPGAPVKPARDGGETAGHIRRLRGERRVARLREALRERDNRLRELEERLADLERSRALQLGRLVAAAARRPVRGLPGLPRQLYRLWKVSGTPQTRPRTATPTRPGGSPGRRPGRAEPPAATFGADHAGPGLDLGEDRLLVSTGQGAGHCAHGPGHCAHRPGHGAAPRVAGVGTRPDLADCAFVARLLPHDAGQVFAGGDPDLLVVDTGAGAPGGPWAYLGEPGVYELERTLDDLLEAARCREVPAVLWGEDPPPGLARASWDLVVPSAVSLRRFHPIGRAADRAEPLAPDPGPGCPPGLRRAAAQVAEAIGVRPVDVAPDALPDLLRRHRVAVAATFRQVLEQLSCGATVLCAPALARRLPAELLPHVHVAGRDPLALLAPPRRAPADPRPALRAIFLHHAAAVRLAEACTRLGVDADPLAGRRVAVVARPAGAEAAERLVHELIGQVHRPVEVSLRGPGAAAAARPLAGHGLVVLDDIAGASSPWVLSWPADPPPATYLADLLCAAECAGADVVGTGPGPGYAYATAIEPVLVRRELHGTGGPADWSARGVRMVRLESAVLTRRRRVPAQAGQARLAGR